MIEQQNQNSGRTNISDILLQSITGILRAQMVSSRSKRDFYISSVVSVYKNKKANVLISLNPGISTLQFKGYLPYFTWITKYLDTLQNSVGLVIFNVNWPLSSLTNS